MDYKHLAVSGNGYELTLAALRVYDKSMIILRRLLVWGSNFFLGVALFILAASITVLATFLNPSFFKQTLSKSSVYDNLVSNGLKLASINPSDDAGPNFNSNVINELTPSIESALTPAWLEATTEQIIDSFDIWLQGRTATPEFSIDAASVKNALNVEITNYLQLRLNNLPACSLSDYSAGYNLITTTCKPPITTTTDDISRTASDFIDDIPLFSKDYFSFGDLVGANRLGDRIWQTVPDIYAWVKATPYVFGAIAIVGIGMIVSLSRNRARGFKIVGHTFLGCGGILIICGAISLIFFGNSSFDFLSGTTAEQANFTKTVIAPPIHFVAQALGNWTLYFGVGYAILGGVCYFTAHRLKLRQIKAERAVAEPQSANNNYSGVVPSPFDAPTSQPSADTQPKLATPPDENPPETEKNPE